MSSIENIGSDASASRNHTINKSSTLNWKYVWYFIYKRMDLEIKKYIHEQGLFYYSILLDRIGSIIANILKNEVEQIQDGEFPEEFTPSSLASWITCSNAGAQGLFYYVEKADHRPCDYYNNVSCMSMQFLLAAKMSDVSFEKIISLRAGMPARKVLSIRDAMPARVLDTYDTAVTRLLKAAKNHIPIHLTAEKISYDKKIANIVAEKAIALIETMKMVTSETLSHERLIEVADVVADSAITIITTAEIQEKATTDAMIASLTATAAIISAKKATDAEKAATEFKKLIEAARTPSHITREKLVEDVNSISNTAYSAAVVAAFEAEGDPGQMSDGGDD
jgi:hypothetical protein